jgi:hypothetical protein
VSVPDERRLVLVVGVGRSGTSLLAGILGQLGLHIPQPEVNANKTNPRGFGEPRWVVDFHTRLLRERHVTVNDARPAAWEVTGRAGESAAVKDELRAWLRRQLEGHGAAVVKDPRTAWFLPLWMEVAGELGVPPAFVTMLRHPAETLTSARTSYGTWQTAASRAAAWLNVSLETEHATRGRRRAFVRYDDLLADWRTQVGPLGERLDLPLLRSIDPARAEQVDGFVDPGLHRHRVRWDELDVPDHLREMADRVWEQLQPLAGADGDTAALHGSLDEAHDAFRALYSEAEAIAQSSVTAAKRRAARSAQPAPAPVPTLRVRLARRVPKRYRKRARQALRRLRGSRS